MKVLIFPLIILLAAALVFYFSRKTKKLKHPRWKQIIITLSAAVMLLILGLAGMFAADTAQDTQCSKIHPVKYQPPLFLKTAIDYFQQGNYDYDSGQCEKAVSDYTEAVLMDSGFAHAYNNRAYTFMRLRLYPEALADLNKAIEISPNYTTALMNRGDIHNYYYQINRQAAIADYTKVLEIEGDNGNRKTACGHLFLAKHNGWNPGTFIGLLTGEAVACQ